MVSETQTGVKQDVINKAALLSENIVKILMMEESHRRVAPILEDKALLDDNDFWNKSVTSTGTSPTTTSTICCSESTSCSVSPAAYLMQQLGRYVTDGCLPHSVPALEHNELFHKCTKEQMDYFDKDAVEAIYTRNIETLRSWRKHRRPLMTSNPFGETLLHLACRRGYLDVVTFLVNEANVTLWVHDEQGKTPLHVAFHSIEPLFELVSFIIKQDPDLLYIADMRGSMPLDYAPKETWSDWISFLGQFDVRKIMPRRQLFFTVPKFSSTIPRSLPFLEDIDRIISDYVSQKRKKKRKSSIRRDQSTTSSEDDTPYNIRNKITSSILEQLLVENDDSISSSMSLQALEDFMKAPPEELISSIRMLKYMDSTDEIQPRLQETFFDDSQMDSSHSSRSSRSTNAISRIDILKQLQEIKICHVKASTSIEIALEMEKQARDDLLWAQSELEEARKECLELSTAINEVEQKSASTQGAEKIMFLKQLQELKISHVTSSTNVEIALERERKASEHLDQAQMEVRIARKECSQFSNAIQSLQSKLD
jgi:Ankyrin repeats (3 copies)